VAVSKGYLTSVLVVDRAAPATNPDMLSCKDDDDDDVDDEEETDDNVLNDDANLEAVSSGVIAFVDEMDSGLVRVAGGPCSCDAVAASGIIVSQALTAAVVEKARKAVRDEGSSGRVKGWIADVVVVMFASFKFGLFGFWTLTTCVQPLSCGVRCCLRTITSL
jgi:hypothetical protein